MGKAPAFQFYAADFLVGTLEMTLEEIGLYIKLLALSWDKGPLPVDTTRLARLAGITEQDFNALWAAVGDKWAKTPDGYVNPRMEEQRREREAYAQRQAERGRRSGESRRAGREGETNLGSTSVQRPRSIPVEPETNQGPLNSSVFDLRSSTPLTIEQSEGKELPPVFRKSSKLTPLIQNHPHCDKAASAACDRNFCVPSFHYKAWRKQVDLDSPQSADVDAYVRAVVASGLAKLPASGPIGGTTAAKFWEQHWADEHADRGPQARPKQGKVGSIFAAAREVIAMQVEHQKAVGDGTER